MPIARADYLTLLRAALPAGELARAQTFANDLRNGYHPNLSAEDLDARELEQLLRAVEQTRPKNALEFDAIEADDAPRAAALRELQGLVNFAIPVTAEEE
jgi:hypothetical protein